MGCGSSREANALAADERSPAPVGQARLTTTHGTTSQTAVSQTPLSQSTHQVHSPTASRAALNPVSTTSLPSGSAISSPRPSTNRHRHRGVVADDNSNLSEHYNQPLLYPRPWKSYNRTWTPSQIRRERQDFFDTRVTGQREVWEALRQVAECIREGELPTAQGILDAVNVTLPTGQIEDGCYDERGFLYKMPEEVLSDPINLEPEKSEVDGETVVGVAADQTKLSSDTLDQQMTSLPQTMIEKQDVSAAEKGKEAVPEDAIQLKCRFSDRGSDVSTYIGRRESVALLVARLKKLTQVPSYARIEVFYLGKKLDQKRTLEVQDYLEGHVLNVFVVGAPKL